MPNLQGIVYVEGVLPYYLKIEHLKKAGRWKSTDSQTFKENISKQILENEREQKKAITRKKN